MVADNRLVCGTCRHRVKGGGKLDLKGTYFCFRNPPIVATVMTPHGPGTVNMRPPVASEEPACGEHCPSLALVAGASDSS